MMMEKSEHNNDHVQREIEQNRKKMEEIERLL